MDGNLLDDTDHSHLETTASLTDVSNHYSMPEVEELELPSSSSLDQPLRLEKNVMKKQKIKTPITNSISPGSNGTRFQFMPRHSSRRKDALKSYCNPAASISFIPSQKSQSNEDKAPYSPTKKPSNCLSLILLLIRLASRN